MNQQELEAKIKEVFSDEEYVKEILSLETAEEVQVSLKEKGIDLTIDEIMQIKELLEKSENEELSDEDLEKVGGGFYVAAIAISASVAALSGAAMITGSQLARRGKRW